jgi:hypothetical protein
MDLNWEEIGAFGETVGAVAVVISLLYLAVQIRQNSRIVRGTAAHGITQTIQAELKWSSDIAQIIITAVERPCSLNKVEAFQLGEWTAAAMMARQNEFIQYEQNLIDAKIWHGSLGILNNMLSIPWMADWWSHYDKSVFTEDFITLVDSVIAEEKSYDYQSYMRKIDGADSAPSLPQGPKNEQDPR